MSPLVSGVVCGSPGDRPGVCGSPSARTGVWLPLYQNWCEAPLVLELVCGYLRWCVAPLVPELVSGSSGARTVV